MLGQVIEERLPVDVIERRATGPDAVQDVDPRLEVVRVAAELHPRPHRSGHVAAQRGADPGERERPICGLVDEAEHAQGAKQAVQRPRPRARRARELVARSRAVCEEVGDAELDGREADPGSDECVEGQLEDSCSRRFVDRFDAQGAHLRICDSSADPIPGRAPTAR